MTMSIYRIFTLLLILNNVIGLSIRYSNNKKANALIHDYMHQESVYGKRNDDGIISQNNILRDIVSGLVLTYESSFNSLCQYEYLELCDEQDNNKYVIGVCVYENYDKYWKMKSMILDPGIYYEDNNIYCYLLKRFYNMIKNKCEDENKELEKDDLSDFIKLELTFWK